MDRLRFHDRIAEYFRTHPIVGILGPRQSGKTTLARAYLRAFAGGDSAIHYFDLENPEHLNRLEEAQLTLTPLRGLIVIDEVQRRPDLFPLLRVLVDRPEGGQTYLILGSASRELLRQSSETLAGRIAYLELPPFSAFEADDHERLWLRGGFPPAYLAPSDRDSMNWRSAYVTSFLERDIPALGIRLAPTALRRLWTMLAHWHGSVVNHADLARSLDISQPTVRRYLDILEGTFAVRLLQPWFANVGKRQVKSPKVYLRDSGVLHALLNLPDRPALDTYARLGASWEGFALEQVIRAAEADAQECFFWATHRGAELDLLLVRGTKRRAFEFKYSSAPKVTRSMHSVLADLDVDRIEIVYPGDATYPLADRVDVVGLGPLIRSGNLL